MMQLKANIKTSINRPLYYLMDIDKVIELIEQVVLCRQLSSLESLILSQSWLGQSYQEMAQGSGYGIPYIKEIGSHLWHEISEVVGEKVTKKNLHLIWNRYKETWINQQRNLEPSTLVRVTKKPVTLTNSSTNIELGISSAPVPIDSPFYICRPPIEELAYAELKKPGCVIRIKAPRKMGKSSLLNRMIVCATDLDYKTVFLDFNEADTAIFASTDKFLRWFSTNVSRQLELNPMLEDYWDEEIGSKVSCKIYFEAYLLKQINVPLVLALNEVNRVFEYPNIAQDFLSMLRVWHEQAQQVEIWQKLRLIVVHSTEVYIPLKINQSPFNVGLSIRLPQFTLEQVQDLAQRYGLDWQDGSEAQKLMAMVGGHPHLVSIALYHLSRRNTSLEELLRAVPTLTGVYGDHLRGHLAMLRDEPELVSALQQVITAEDSVQLEAIAAYKLESMGLVQLDGNKAKPSCQLYRLYFRKQLA